MTITELMPSGNQKSFGGKALVLTQDNGEVWLQSYDTIVCSFRNGEFKKHYNGYSATTMRHINSFRDDFYRDALTKKQWEALPVTRI